MRPTWLFGHEKAISQIKYNTEGDLIFTCARDNSPCVWFSENGERVGTYDGHNGAIFAIDVSWDSTKLATGSGDFSTKIWDTEIGTVLYSLDSYTTSTAVGFNCDGNLLMFATRKQMAKPSGIFLYDLRDQNQIANNSAMKSITLDGSIESALWGPADEFIVIGFDRGRISQYDWTNETVMKAVDDIHKDRVTDMQYSKDQTFMITSSSDTTARLWDLRSLTNLKTYLTERPVNSAAISPIRDHVLLGGGQEARSVTTTAAQVGRFEARFFHMIFEEEFAQVSDHFGPINSVAFHPNGKQYISGGEDGLVRVHNFESSYLEFELEY